MIDFGHFFEELYELFRREEIRKPLLVVLPTIAILAFLSGRCYSALRRKYRGADQKVKPDPRVPELERDIENLQREHAIGTARLERARLAVSATGPGLWLSIPPGQPANYRLLLKSSIPIYVIANLKGGVGETTIATGLAAHFANPFSDQGRKCERVLLIDLDFQGSSSSMALAVKDRIPEGGNISQASRLISGSVAPHDLLLMHQRVKGLDKLSNGHDVDFHAVPAYYDLAQTENRLMIEWLISDTDADIRYNLAALLLNEEVQRRYDRIIIDAPPRLTTAHVQSLAAATHVLIPTVLDQLSGEAVGSFVEQLIVHVGLWPCLKIIGVVGSMTKNGQDKDLVTFEEEGRLTIRQALEQKKDEHGLRAVATELLPRACFIPEVAALGRAAGNRIGYLDEGSEGERIRGIFDRLGVAVIGASSNLRELRDLVRT